MMMFVLPEVMYQQPALFVPHYSLVSLRLLFQIPSFCEQKEVPLPCTIMSFWGSVTSQIPLFKSWTEHPEDETINW